MSNSDYLLIGAITSNLTWDDVKVWHNSARANGYTGDIALLVYGAPNDQLMAEINNHGIIWDIIPFNSAVQDINTFMSYRFKWIREFLLRNEGSASPYKWVCITDVNDVVFQGDISIHKPHYLMVGGENLRYRDEPWSRANMIGCFGSDQFIALRDTEIACAGVILGPVRIVKGFLLLLFAVSMTAKSSPNGGGPDQSALNVIINEVDFGNNWVFYVDNSWVAHLGTHPVAIANKSGDVGLSGEDFTDKFIHDSHGIRMNDDGTFKDIISPLTGLPVSVVHQYNRIPNLKEFYKKKYE